MTRSAAPVLMVIDAYIFGLDCDLQGETWRAPSRIPPGCSSMRGPRGIRRSASLLLRREARFSMKPVKRKKLAPQSTSSLHVGEKAQLCSRPLGCRDCARPRGSRTRRGAGRGQRASAAADEMARGSRVARGRRCRSSRGSLRVDRGAAGCGAHAAARGGAGDRRRPPRRGETSLGLRSNSSAPPAPNATSARPRLCSPSASRRPGRGRHPPAEGSPRDRAARRRP